MVESEEAVAEALLKAVGVDDHEPEVVGMVLDGKPIELLVERKPTSELECFDGTGVAQVLKTLGGVDHGIDGGWDPAELEGNSDLNDVGDPFIVESVPAQFRKGGKVTSALCKPEGKIRFDRLGVLAGMPLIKLIFEETGIDDTGRTTG